MGAPGVVIAPFCNSARSGPVACSDEPVGPLSATAEGAASTSGGPWDPARKTTASSSLRLHLRVRVRDGHLRSPGGFQWDDRQMRFLPQRHDWTKVADT